VGTGFNTVRSYIFSIYFSSNVFCSPRNKEELFNLRHVSARNVIERIFGVLNGCFRILLLPAEFSLEVQARIPAALCAIHNFIRTHEPSQPEDDGESGDEVDGDQQYPDDDQAMDGAADAGGENLDGRAHQMCKEIAEAMWADYQGLMRQRDMENSSESDGDSVM
jgi:hypothetical protein